jgi:hypothetical protein
MWASTSRSTSRVTGAAPEDFPDEGLPTLPSQRAGGSVQPLQATTQRALPSSADAIASTGSAV